MANRYKVTENSVCGPLSTFELHRAGRVMASFSKRCSGTVPLTSKFTVIMLQSRSVREDTMGWFDRLFGRTSAPGTPLFARFRRKSRAPTDPDLLKIAKDRKRHISRRAVRDEYNRLLLEKYAHDKS